MEYGVGRDFVEIPPLEYERGEKSRLFREQLEEQGVYKYRIDRGVGLMALEHLIQVTSILPDPGDDYHLKFNWVYRDYSRLPDRSFLRFSDDAFIFNKQDYRKWKIIPLSRRVPSGYLRFAIDDYIEPLKEKSAVVGRNQ